MSSSSDPPPIRAAGSGGNHVSDNSGEEERKDEEGFDSLFSGAGNDDEGDGVELWNQNSSGGLEPLHPPERNNGNSTFDSDVTETPTTVGTSISMSDASTPAASESAAPPAATSTQASEEAAAPPMAGAGAAGSGAGSGAGAGAAPSVTERKGDVEPVRRFSGASAASLTGESSTRRRVSFARLTTSLTPLFGRTSSHVEEGSSRAVTASTTSLMTRSETTSRRNHFQTASSSSPAGASASAASAAAGRGTIEEDERRTIPQGRNLDRSRSVNIFSSFRTGGARQVSSLNEDDLGPNRMRRAATSNSNTSPSNMTSSTSASATSFGAGTGGASAATATSGHPIAGGGVRNMGFARRSGAMSRFQTHNPSTVMASLKGSTYGGSASAGTSYSHHYNQSSLTSSVTGSGAAGSLGASGHQYHHHSHTEPDGTKSRAYRRYALGDKVLVSNTQSRWATLVNRHGFPAGGGVTPEEQRPPYSYVLATVKTVHYKEDAVYYIVTRADTGMDQRADAEWMEPIRTARGEAAALRAATESRARPHGGEADGAFGPGGPPSHGAGANEQNRPKNHLLSCLAMTLLVFLTPFLLLYDCFVQVIGERLLKLGRWALKNIRKHGQRFLYGLAPYTCTMRMTAINVMVFCSVWYLFIDQARLAFISPSSDVALAIVSLIVWCVLLIELASEVFIRPEGYQCLVVSEKAYSPSTARYINAFHLWVELISLIIFVPNFVCLLSNNYTCGSRPNLSYLNAVFMAILGPKRVHAFYGYAYTALLRLRIFGLVRHWRNMWINNTFVLMKWQSTQARSILSGIFVPPKISSQDSTRMRADKKDTEQKIKDESLVNASNIGTALTVTNSHRALMIVCIITGLLPVLGTLMTHGGTNRTAREMVKQLQQLNLDLDNLTSRDECDFFVNSVLFWILGLTTGQTSSFLSRKGPFLLMVSIEPRRCEEFFNVTYEGVPTQTLCDPNLNHTHFTQLVPFCDYWKDFNKNTSLEDIASRVDIRVGAIEQIVEEKNSTLDEGHGPIEKTFKVTALFNHTVSVQRAAFSSLFLQISLLLCVLVGLSVLRRDSVLLVLGPLRRMLVIVAQYAKNPLSTEQSNEIKNGDNNSKEDSRPDGGSKEYSLGSFETEQLINAVSKITDLLRKCWGVAGAGIISTNLAIQEGALAEVFNPTVPGKSVYALFGFAAINDFDHILRQLGEKVMILINDVAAVLHGEVFRWGFGDSGQCNKNLGSAFLMVFRIGLVKEVIDKLEEAKMNIFQPTIKKAVRRKNHNSSKSSSMSASYNESFSGEQGFKTPRPRRKKSVQVNRGRTAAMSLSLRSLPGIQMFTDRAVIGMLKSFAGIYRDYKLLSWKKEFLPGAGVGAFSVNMIFGMDAGWAVEGAVGSEYKIDATYLSPHVNMASRMMSACKQYGVSILLSQAVQELMSETACSKLRHLDTVTVKGSVMVQRIFTYDARYKEVDFFLYNRSDEQADSDAERYNHNVWNTDQDLCAMRRHVTEDFEDEFRKGRDLYIKGDWPQARKHLEAANEIMVENVMEGGYNEDELEELRDRIMDGEDARAAEEELRNETGDGPSRRLIAYMENEGGVAPATWQGFRPLTSK